jgi:predicted NBD/HSP70 family sugar kinase
MRSGTNFPAVGGYNKAVILDAIRRAPTGISRVEVAERTGLSAQTATNVCRRLIADGLICETGTVIAGPGKPRRILELRRDGRYAIGIHLDPSVITVVLLDLSGAVVAHTAIPTTTSVEVDNVIDLVATAVERVVADSAVDAARIIGAGVAAPGPIDTASGSVINPPLLESWGRVPVRDALAGRLAMPVLLEKDVTAAAVAENWAGESDGNFVFFYYGTGVGVGIALQNEVIRGSSGNSGEVGSLLVGGGGVTHPVTGRWRLGEAIMPSNVVRRARGLGLLASVDDSGHETDLAAFQAIASLAGAGEAAALSLVDDIADDIAEGLVSIIDLLDVGRVVFGGPFWSPLSALLLERIPTRISDSRYLVLPHVISFVEAIVGQDVAATGAACLVLDHALSPRPQTLLISHSAT